jgi:hypothetical protein
MPSGGVSSDFPSRAPRPPARAPILSLFPSDPTPPAPHPAPPCCLLSTLSTRLSAKPPPVRLQCRQAQPCPTRLFFHGLGVRGDGTGEAGPSVPEPSSGPLSPGGKKVCGTFAINVERRLPAMRYIVEAMDCILLKRS